MHALTYCHLLANFFLVTSSFAATDGLPLPQVSGKKSIEHFEVSIVTGHDKDGQTRAPYLIITEQRFIGNPQIPDAILTSETLRVLVSGLLVSTTSDIQMGNHKVTVVRKIYEFKPPAKRYILYPSNFDNLKDSSPFSGLIIDTDGKEIPGGIGLPQKAPKIEE